MGLKDKLRNEIRQNVPSIECQFLGETVFVREMSNQDRDEWQELLAKQRETGFTPNTTALGIVYSCYDKIGSRIFDADDAGMIGALPVSKTKDVIAAIRKVSGTAEGDLGNSESGPTGSQNSDSQKNSDSEVSAS